MLLAVNGAAAIPDAFVATNMNELALPNVPDAPVPGAANVTFTPGTGLLFASLAVTASGFVNAVLIAASCGVVPVFRLMETAVPA